MAIKLRHWRKLSRKDWAGRSLQPDISDIEGYRCWVYGGDKSFERWVRDNMTGNYECDFRFNSGNVMHTVWIHQEKDAMLFLLKWGGDNET